MTKLISRKRHHKRKLLSNRNIIISLIVFVQFILFTQYKFVIQDSGSESDSIHVRPAMKVTKDGTTWTPVNPWDEPPKDFFNENDTGSFENCTGSFTPIKKHTQFNKNQSDEDIGTIMISCHEILYRAPKKAIQNSGKVIIGILSAASSYGPRRRNYIRSTWARKYPGVFFLVAGPWEDIEKEYMYYQDMIWIDEDEVYKGEDSVLTYKTMSYFAITHKLAKSVEDGGFSYAVKTDDDSYVNVEGIYDKVFHTGKDGNGDSDGKLHYFGQCMSMVSCSFHDSSSSPSKLTLLVPLFPLS